jgi:hypothetical protein
MRIKEIDLSGFKRFTHLKIIDLPTTAKIIILAGPNGNGKSSLFDAFNSYHHGKFSGLGMQWLEDYHARSADTGRSLPSRFERIKIDFHEALDPKQWKKAFYIRSAYRNDPEFKTNNLQRTPSPLDEKRIEHLIDNDASVARNYRRIASLAVEELYGGAPDEKTFGRFRFETRDIINDHLRRLFPNLSLTGLGRPLESGPLLHERPKQRFLIQKSIGRRKSGF